MIIVHFRHLYQENIANQQKLEQRVVQEQKQQEFERMTRRRSLSTPPRDGPQSNRSTPLRIYSPPNAPMSPPNVPMSPPNVPMSPPNVPMSPPNVPMSPPNVPMFPPNVPMFPPNVPMSPPNVPMSPPNAQMYPRNIPLSLPSGPISLRQVQSPIQRSGNIASTRQVQSPRQESLLSRTESMKSDIMSPPIISSSGFNIPRHLPPTGNINSPTLLLSQKNLQNQPVLRLSRNVKSSDSAHPPANSKSIPKVVTVPIVQESLSESNIPSVPAVTSSPLATSSSVTSYSNVASPLAAKNPATFEQSNDQTRVLSPPNIMSPPLRHPLTHVQSSNSFSSSDKYFTPPPVPQSSSNYSTIIHEISPELLPPVAQEGVNHVQLTEQSQLPTTNVPVQQNLRRNYEQIPQVPAEEDVQLKLQKMIQEKLRLEEKMMIAKRREGEMIAKKEEQITRKKSLTKTIEKSHSKMLQEQQNIPQRSAESEPTTKPPVQWQAANKTSYSKETFSQTQTSTTKETVQQTVKQSGHVQTKTSSHKQQTVLNERTCAPPSSTEQKREVTKEESANMIEKLKQSARDKIADFQKNLPLSKCLNDAEKERLREENRIRDEQIRKMQEYNLDEKQKKNLCKSICTSELSDASGIQDLRRVKTDNRNIPFLDPHQQDGAEGIATEDSMLAFDATTADVTIQCEKQTDKLKKDANKKHKEHNKDENLKSSDPARYKEEKRKVELKKLQEQFKRDQILIQEEMAKKELKKQQDEEQRRKERLLKMERETEQKKILAKIIYEEEQKLLEQKKKLEEKIKSEELQRAETEKKLEAEVHKQKLRKNLSHQSRSKESNAGKSDVQKIKKSKVKTKESIQDSYQSTKLKPYEKQRVAMQKVVQQQYKDGARKLNEKLKKNSPSYQEDNIYEDIDASESREENLDALKIQEMKQMQEEEKQYLEYQQILDTKRQHEEDSDDYASEWDGSDFSRGEDYSLEQEEPFDELKATSEEELLEAQEKSIRNLERQIRKQEKSRQLNNGSQKQPLQKIPGYQKPRLYSRKEPKRRQYASTGDLSKSNSKTLPVTKFSPDPMEFGFKPIENPILSKSMSNLEAGGSAEAGAAVAGAQAGAKATAALAAQEEELKRRHSTDGSLFKSHPSMSASLGDLQQVRDQCNENI